jgi:hypothetical protein
MEEIKEKQPNTEKPGIETKTPEKSKESKVLEQTDEEKKEQERTTINKGLFLKHFADHRVADVVCKKIGIVFKTFWEWKKEDPEFAEAIRKIDEQRNDAVEDILLGLVFIKHDAPSVRYYLDRRHSGYKPHSSMEVEAGPGDAQETIIKIMQGLALIILKNGESKPTNEKGDGTGGENGNQRPTDRKNDTNQGQERKDGAVHAEPGAEILLGKKDEEKPHIESKAEGTK